MTASYSAHGLTKDECGRTCKRQGVALWDASVCFVADAGIVKGERVAIVHFLDSMGARLVRMTDIRLLPRSIT